MENDSLLAILLVSSSPKGAALAFAYPPCPKPLPRLSKPIYPHLAQKEEPDDGAEQESPASGPGFFANAEQEGDPYQTYLGVDVDLLAHVLVPQRKELQDTKFEVVLDHLAFVGHAVNLERSRRHRAAKATDPSKSPSAPLPVSPMLQPQEDGVAAHMLASISTLADFPPSETHPTFNTAHSTVPVQLDAFNVVLVIDTPPDKHLTNHLDVYYRDIIIKLTAAIKHEEHRDNCLSKQAIQMVNTREWFKESRGSLEACTAEQIAKSSLCANLAHVFDSISKGQIAKIANLNNNLSLSLILHHELFQTSAESYTLDWLSSIRRPVDDDLQGLCPWQTLLPLQDPALMLKELENTTAPDVPLMQFLELCTPSISFQEYSTLLDIDSTALKAIVDHLVHWRKARVINLVNLKHSYKPNPRLDPRKLPMLSEQFAQLFAGLPPLVAILGALASPKPFGSIMTDSSHRALWIDVLVWLLSNDLVVEMRTFFRINVNPFIKSRVKEGNAQAATESHWQQTDASTNAPNNPFFASSANRPSDASSDILPGSSPFKRLRDLEGHLSGVSLRTDTTGGTTWSDDAAAELASVIAEPGQPTARERLWLTEIMAGKPEPAREYFERICPFLNGRVDLEQILYRTGLTRKHLRSVFTAFADHIIRFETSI